MNLARVAALDKAIKLHMVQKYDLQGVDSDGRGIYAHEWTQDDLTFVISFERWRNGVTKTDGDLEQWIEFAERHGVRVVGIKDEGASPFKKYLGYGLAAAAGAGAVWLFRDGGTEEAPLDPNKKPVTPDDVVRVLFDTNPSPTKDNEP